ncbi:MAG: PPOX class F420-dependent oxidoreductase [Nitrosarchaeum sp.]
MKIQDIINQKYLSLETYRKNNLPVQTPVWFVVHKDTIHIVTREKTGKIKRLKNNNNVQIAPCTFNGKITGKAATGKAVFSPPEDVQMVLNLRRKKYGVMEIIARFVSRKKGNLVVFSIKLDET